MVKNVTTATIQIKRKDESTSVLGYHNEIIVNRAELTDFLLRDVFKGHHVQITNYIMTREPVHAKR